jgi:Uma2 family endonuclease
VDNEDQGARIRQDEVVTMTANALPHYPSPGQPWTIDDLKLLPEDGMWYELIDGSLLVSPMPAIPHVRAANRLRRLLDRVAPPGLEVIQEGGIAIGGRTTYLGPDICVVHAPALDGTGDNLDSADVRLVVEVLSPSNRGRDLVLKRHYYAAGGIPHYWIVDPAARTLTELTLDGDSYRETNVVLAGSVWRTTEPFPIMLDPADFL